MIYTIGGGILHVGYGYAILTGNDATLLYPVASFIEMIHTNPKRVVPVGIAFYCVPAKFVDIGAILATALSLYVGKGQHSVVRNLSIPTRVVFILGIMGAVSFEVRILFRDRALPFVTLPIVLPFEGIPHIMAVGRMFGHCQVLTDNLVLAGGESYVVILLGDGTPGITTGVGKRVFFVKGVFHGEFAVRARRDDHNGGIGIGVGICQRDGEIVQGQFYVVVVSCGGRTGIKIDAVVVEIELSANRLVGRHLDLLNLGPGNAFLQGIGQEGDVRGLVVDLESVMSVGLSVRCGRTAVAVFTKIYGIVGFDLLLFVRYSSNVTNH